AVQIANGVRYGLVTSLFTQDLGRALRLADQFDAGMVRVNAPTSGVDFHAPFGGAKQSSYGPREQGLAARDFYTQTRTVTIVPWSPRGHLEKISLRRDVAPRTVVAAGYTRTRFRETAVSARWEVTGMRDRAGRAADPGAGAHDLGQVRGIPGASAAGAAWAGDRAGRPGRLTGPDAEAALCDATVVPVVTGHVAWPP